MLMPPFYGLLHVGRSGAGMLLFMIYRQNIRSLHDLQGHGMLLYVVPSLDHKYVVTTILAIVQRQE